MAHCRSDRRWRRNTKSVLKTLTPYTRSGEYIRLFSFRYLADVLCRLHVIAEAITSLHGEIWLGKCIVNHPDIITIFVDITPLYHTGHPRAKGIQHLIGLLSL